MALTKDQIGTIKKFIKSRGFDTIEVEMEILDHVASAVESKIGQDEKLTIDKAIRQVHESFGIMGFSSIEEATSLSVHKRINRDFKQQLINSFRLPRLLYTLAIAALVYFVLLSIIPQASDGKPSLLIYAVFGLIGGIPLLIHQRLFKPWQKQSMVSKQLLLPGFFMIYANIFLIQFAEGIPSQAIHNGVLIFSSLTVALELLVLTAVIRSAKEWATEQWLKYA